MVSGQDVLVGAGIAVAVSVFAGRVQDKTWVSELFNDATDAAPQPSTVTQPVPDPSPGGQAVIEPVSTTGGETFDPSEDASTFVGVTETREFMNAMNETSSSGPSLDTESREKRLADINKQLEEDTSTTTFVGL